MGIDWNVEYTCKRCGKVHRGKEAWAKEYKAVIFKGTCEFCPNCVTQEDCDKQRRN